MRPYQNPGRMIPDRNIHRSARWAAIRTLVWGRRSSLPVHGAFQLRLPFPATRRSLAPAHKNVRPTTAAGPLGLLLAAVALAGCQSVLVSSYISPRVTGRVLAADTRQPIANVKVKRYNPNANLNYDDPARGGRKMESIPGTRTDAAGRFVLDAERDLTLLQQQVWFSVTVSFEHEGYQTLRTNITAAHITTNAPDGAPVVNAGDILLHPTSP